MGFTRTRADHLIDNVLRVVYSTGVLAEPCSDGRPGRSSFPSASATDAATGIVYPGAPGAADLGDDGAVGAADDAIMDGVYNTTNPTHRADLNGDGKIDIDDAKKNGIRRKAGQVRFV